ncbi:MAG: C40 family peptidase [Clostridia bacterium]|nr:C40 family peptidase [Clostridia bacterium]
MAQIGKPYVWGAKGPNSFDCSGLVYYAYTSLGISVPRATEGYKTKTAYEISWSEAQPGDILIIYQSERGSSYTSGHAGIYLGNDEYIHSPQTGQKVKTAKGAQKRFTHVFRFTN